MCLPISLAPSSRGLQVAKPSDLDAASTWASLIVDVVAGRVLGSDNFSCMLLLNVFTYTCRRMCILSEYKKEPPPRRCWHRGVHNVKAEIVGRVFDNVIFWVKDVRPNMHLKVQKSVCASPVEKKSHG